MVDVVYVVGKGAKDNNDRPLKWSLRSLDRFAKNVGRVIVAGYPPDWLSSEAIKVPYNQTHGKHLNMLLTMAEAVKQLKLSSPFLFSADDHYFCKVVDLDEWPRYCHGKLPSMRLWQKKHTKQEEKPSGYMMNMFQTRFILQEEGLPFHMTCCHLDAWIDPYDFDEAVKIAIKNEYRCKAGIEPLCLLNALYEKRLTDAGIEVQFTEYKRDWKIKTVKDCEKALNSTLQVFSTCSGFETTPEAIQWFDTFFNVPSKYEIQ